MAFDCVSSCAGQFGAGPNNMVAAECSGGGSMVAFPQAGLGSCSACRAKADSLCDLEAGQGQGQLSRLSREATQRQSIPPLGPRATMRSASGFKNQLGGFFDALGCYFQSDWMLADFEPPFSPYSGCTDIRADNFNADACFENMSCTFSGPYAEVYSQEYLMSASPCQFVCSTTLGGSTTGGGITDSTFGTGKDPKGKGKRRGMRSASGTSNDFGGLSFQCQDEPFASVTGKGKEGYNEPDISSEPPWWALTALGWVAGLKKQKSCICPQQDGSSITLTDCNRLQPCEKCCTNSTGGYAGGGYDPNQSSLTEG